MCTWTSDSFADSGHRDEGISLLGISFINKSKRNKRIKTQIANKRAAMQTP